MFNFNKPTTPTKNSENSGIGKFQKYEDCVQLESFIEKSLFGEDATSSSWTHTQLAVNDGTLAFVSFLTKQHYLPSAVIIEHLFGALSPGLSPHQCFPFTQLKHFANIRSDRRREPSMEKLGDMDSVDYEWLPQDQAQQQTALKVFAYLEQFRLFMSHHPLSLGDDGWAPIYKHRSGKPAPPTPGKRRSMRRSASVEQETNVVTNFNLLNFIIHMEKLISHALVVRKQVVEMVKEAMSLQASEKRNSRRRRSSTITSQDIFEKIQTIILQEKSSLSQLSVLRLGLAWILNLLQDDLDQRDTIDSSSSSSSSSSKNYDASMVFLYLTTPDRSITKQYTTLLMDIFENLTEFSQLAIKEQHLLDQLDTIDDESNRKIFGGFVQTDETHARVLAPLSFTFVHLLNLFARIQHQMFHEDGLEKVKRLSKYGKRLLTSTTGHDNRFDQFVDEFQVIIERFDPSLVNKITYAPFKCTLIRRLLEKFSTRAISSKISSDYHQQALSFDLLDKVYLKLEPADGEDDLGKAYITYFNLILQLLQAFITVNEPEPTTLEKFGENVIQKKFLEKYKSIIVQSNFEQEQEQKIMQYLSMIELIF